MRTQAIDDIHVIRDHIEVPGIGVLDINAFVVGADQPVLVDTGRPVEREAFIKELSTIIDTAELRYVWITHPDRDHMGALFDILALAPEARLVTTFAAAGYMTVEFPVPMDRLYLLNPGQSLDVGNGRTLTAFRPPLFDSPMTVGFFDSETGTCVSSDCFGAPLPSISDAETDDVSTIDAAAVRQAQLLWAGIDSPWVTMVEREQFAASYDVIRQKAPTSILSTHLPPAPGRTEDFLDFLAEAPTTTPWVGPDQAALEAMLAQMH